MFIRTLLTLNTQAPYFSNLGSISWHVTLCYISVAFDALRDTQTNATIWTKLILRVNVSIICSHNMKIQWIIKFKALSNKNITNNFVSLIYEAKLTVPRGLVRLNLFVYGVPSILDTYHIKMCHRHIECHYLCKNTCIKFGFTSAYKTTNSALYKLSIT